MQLLRRLSLVLFVPLSATALLLGTPVDGGVAEDPTQAQASTFSHSSDSGTVVLLVSVLTTYTNRAMTVYGDGRLIVTQYGAERTLVREKEFRLDPSGVRELLQIAVDHGIVEYDETDIRARQIRGKTDEGIDAFIGAATTHVTIALDGYALAGEAARRIDRTIRVRAAKPSAHRFPDMPEFQGIIALQKQLYTYWKKAGWELW